MSETRQLAVGILALALAGGVTASAQRRTTAKPVVEPAKLTCPYVLGDGVQTKRTFCDVTIGSNPAEGIVIPLPPHTGPVTLRFDLHARHTYSEELSKSARGFRRYTASLGVFTADNTLVSRAAMQAEVRTATDLFDRVAGGAGAAGVKAVAPAGIESVTITIPAAETSASILGERLTEERADVRETFTAPGRPVAIISNVTLEYRPGPAPRAPARRR